MYNIPVIELQEILRVSYGLWRWQLHRVVRMLLVYLMFMDPCIIVQFLQCKTQQDATVYQNFIIPYFKWSSTCFGRHHQEPKTAQAASGFAHVEGCRTCSCRTLSGSVRWQRPTACKQSAESVWHTPDAVCTFLGFWWWTERPPETFRVLLQSKINLSYCASFLVLLQKYFTMHGPTNVKWAIAVIVTERIVCLTL